MSLFRNSLLLLALMVSASALAIVMRPTSRIADQHPEMNLEQLVPTNFGDWRQVQQPRAQIINPQQAELLSKLYTQTLSRTYVNAEGRIVMLSIAYGANQNDSVALHYPEVCYPAQGFQLHSNEKGVLATDFGTIRVRRLITKLGDRNEPVTYWSVLGDKVVQGGIETKLEQLKYGFRSEIPDGLLFRVSALDRDSKQAFNVIDGFVAQFVAAIPVTAKRRLTGLEAAQ